MIKRGFDIAAATAGLVLTSPVFLIIAGLIRALAGPPVFFKQTRVGKGGREFTMIKFRTMALAPGAEKGAFEPGDLSRVTPVGRFLRRTKLDELPQLINVVRGEMSLVGPRPEVPKWVAAYPERWAAVHRVRPGITDPAALIYRREEAILGAAPDPDRTYRDEILPRKLALYEEYIGTSNFFTDFAVLMKTVFSVFRP
jgi:lipopolysaccharide/colanic/teichoic acid biosynthesis glycosyltransferase